MGNRIAALTGLSVLVGTAAAAPAATGIVLGDSHGVALAEVSGLKNFAHISVHIRGPKAVEQIEHAPAGSTAFVVLGTNDANGSIARLDKSIDDILDAAAKKRLPPDLSLPLPLPQLAGDRLWMNLRSTSCASSVITLRHRRIKS